MTYGAAMTCLARGEPVARVKWQAFNTPRLELRGERDQVCRVFADLPYLNPVPFVAEREDIVADDWFGA